MSPLLSIVFVTHGDRVEMVKRLLSSMARAEREEWLEIIGVDNGSEPSAAAYMRAEHPRVGVIENSENVGTSRAFNAGIRRALGEWVMIINDDSGIPEGMLDRLRRFLRDNPSCDGLALGLKRDQDHFQAIRLRIVNTTKKHPRRKKRATFVGTGNLLIRKSLIEEIGLYDENYFAGNEDMDLSFRLKRAGARIYFNPRFFIYHHHVYRERKTHWADFLTARRLSDIYFAKKFFPLLTPFVRWYAFRHFRARCGDRVDRETLIRARDIFRLKRDSFYAIQKSLVTGGIESTHRAIFASEEL
jgi:GT2 family glycosyltransferase